jgi:transcriptional regulator with XRE-family HTH domain
MSSIGSRLKEWRIEEGMTLQELADFIEVSKATLSQIENDKSIPSGQTIIRLTDYPFIEIHWLLTGRYDDKKEILYGKIEERSIKIKKLEKQNDKLKKQNKKGK